MGSTDGWREPWISVVINRTQSHWAWFEGLTLKGSWTTPHLLEAHLTATSTYGIPDEMLDSGLRDVLKARHDAEELPPTMYIASLVKPQTTKWLIRCPHATSIESSGVMRETIHDGFFGVDRALNLRAAACKYGNPVLVIDADTAITLTSSDGLGNFIGGAILPGLTAQLKLLSGHAEAWPEVEIPHEIPEKYASSTAEAIQSGVINVLLGGLSAYIKRFGERSDALSVILTGEESELLLRWLPLAYPDLSRVKLIAEAPHALSHYAMRWVYIQNNCCKGMDGSPGYLNAKFRKKFDGKYYDGCVREYLPALDEEANTRPAWWSIQYDDGDREEVDEQELHEGMQLASEPPVEESGSAQKRRRRKKSDEPPPKRRSSRDKRTQVEEVARATTEDASANLTAHPDANPNAHPNANPDPDPHENPLANHSHAVTPELHGVVPEPASEDVEGNVDVEEVDEVDDEPVPTTA